MDETEFWRHYFCRVAHLRTQAGLAPLLALKTPEERERDAAAAAAAAEAYRVKTWPASALSGETCVEVRVRFARAKTRSEQELV